MFLVFEFVCVTPHSCLKVRGWGWWWWVVAYSILVSAQGPLVLGFWVLRLRVWGQGLTIINWIQSINTIYETHSDFLSSEQDFPLGVDDAEALRGPELGKVGQLVVPGDLPHVGRGGDALRDQGPVEIKRRCLVLRENNEKEIIRETKVSSNLLIDLLNELVLIFLTQTMSEDLAFCVIWSGVETLGVFWVHVTIVRLEWNSMKVRLGLPFR